MSPLARPPVIAVLNGAVVFFEQVTAKRSTTTFVRVQCFSGEPRTVIETIPGDEQILTKLLELAEYSFSIADLFVPRSRWTKAELQRRFPHAIVAELKNAPSP